ncbi:MAG: hypothetical protein ACREO8_06750 [Luteimonas sp.]
MSTLDLEKLPANATLKIEREETEGERRVRLSKDVVLFLVAIVFVAIMTWLCVRTLLDPAGSSDDRKWAMSLLTGATGGLIGYLVRK